MKSRLKDRVRFSTPQLEYLPRERQGRLKRGLSLESGALQNDIKYRWDTEQLQEEIENIQEENRRLELENLVYSRYLKRANNSKFIETFNEYDSQDNAIQKDISALRNRAAVASRLPKVARRLSIRRNSVNSTRAARLWNKLLSNIREIADTQRLKLVEQEKLPSVTYEIEHTKLDWERMKANALLEYEQFDVQLRSIEADIKAEQALQNDLKRHINLFQYSVTTSKSNRKRFRISGDILIDRVDRKIQKSRRLIDYLHIDNQLTQARIRALDSVLRDLDNFHEKTDEIDINFVRAQKTDYAGIYKTLDKQYKTDKSAQYPLLDDLHKWKQKLSELEMLNIDDEHQHQLVDNYLEKLNSEIDLINAENELLVDENKLLQEQIADVKKVPTITEYAYLIQQTKYLRHQIDIWTRRVNIAEAFLSQMKRQTKSPNVLPPIKQNHVHKY